MTFTSPAFLGVLGLLVPIVVLFLVRRKRNVVRVPSTIVWRLGARVVAKNRRFRDLRRLLALALCLLGVAALALSAARPTGSHLPSTQVYVVDLSASMDGAPLREAKRFITRDVASLGPLDRVAIVTAAGDVNVALPPSLPGPALDAAIARLTARARTVSLEEATGLGVRLAGRGHGARVVVVSDVPVDAETARAPGVSVFQRRVGPPSRDNVGITAFHSRPALDGADDTLREATIGVATSSTRARRVRLSITEEGGVVTERTAEVAPGVGATVRVTLRSGGRVSARVAPIDGLADAMAIDDEAVLVEPPRRKLRVALVSDPTPGSGDETSAFFLRQALLAAGVGTVTDVRFDAPAPRTADVDVAVVVRPGSGVPADVPALYVGREPSPGASDRGPTFVARDAERSELHLRTIATDDALLRGVGLDDLTVVRARVAVPPRGARSLVELDGGATLIAGGSGAHAWVWLGIDPAFTDLVLRVAFPVLVSNVVAELGGGAAIASADTAPATEVALAVPDVATPLPPAAEPRWRVPLAPSALLAFVGAALLALELLITYRGRRAAAPAPATSADASPEKAFAS